MATTSQKHENTNEMESIQKGTIAAPMYGTIKIHKEDLPIRPIVADPENSLDTVQKALIPILKRYIDKANHPYTIKNTTQMVQRLEERKAQQREKREKMMEVGHNMFTLDIEAMYTNMDVQMFLRIINEEYDEEIFKSTGVRLEQLTRLLRICLLESTYIAVPDQQDEERFYRQKKGVPMGGHLSFFIAEIYTNYAIKKALKNFKISFICVDMWMIYSSLPTHSKLMK